MQCADILCSALHSLSRNFDGRWLWPWFAVRLYDRRMCGLATGARSSAPLRCKWVSCYVPTHLKGALLSAPRPLGASSRCEGFLLLHLISTCLDALGSHTTIQHFVQFHSGTLCGLA